MSKAEQRALEAYPPKYVKQERHLKRMQSERIDTHRPIRAIYIKGYQQAEKDLALTWEDMMIIHKCIKDAMNYHLYKMMEGAEGQKVVYQEVLNRFNKQKER
jgi:hypothetical protein